jgi:hypothetical protein
MSMIDVPSLFLNEFCHNIRTHTIAGHRNIAGVIFAELVSNVATQLTTGISIFSRAAFP